MDRKYYYIILSVPVYGVLYGITALSTVLALLFAFAKNEKGVRKIMSFWARGIFTVMGKKLTVDGKPSANTPWYQ